MPKKKAAREALPVSKVEIDFVVLADFAQAAQGKLNLIGGGWNIHNAKQYPSNLQFGVGIGILVPWSLTNRKFKFKFVIMTDGNQLADGGGDFEVGRQPGMPAGMVQRVVVGFSGQIQLPKPGTYELIVSTSEDEKRITFEALPVPSGG